MADSDISDPDKVLKDKPTIFISYSHKDEVWKDRVVVQLGVLAKQNLLSIWDDRRIDSGDDWFPEIEKAINSSSAAILLISADFLNSNFILNEEIPKLLNLRQKKGLRVIPLIVKPCPWDQVDWLKKIQARPKDGRALSGGSDYQIDSDLSDLAKEVARLMSKTAVAASSQAMSPVLPDRIMVSKLPETGPELFGRERELALLDKAWDGPHQNIVCFSAMGGAGKTSLVKKWLNLIARDNYRGAEEVYAWSFYSQGAEEGKQASADEFISHALGWFGYEGPMDKSGWEKGEQLAELIRKKRTLFILDGVEPLQYPPGEMQGRLKDQGLQSLLRELAAQNNGLCIITTRLPVADIEDAKETVQDIPLEHLSEEAGTQLLRSMGVTGSDTELKQASADFKGHALALTLLGSYLSAVHDGDIRKRDLIPKLTDDEKKGGHARRVMRSYIKWLAGKPELNILFLMGLFDKPATGGAIAALRAKPVIKNLTDGICKLSEGQWQFAVQHLRDLRLIDKKIDKAPDTLDCHPLIREYFGERLKLKHQVAWKKAHSKLYDFFKAQAPEHPNTIEEMTPLFSAVAHGCAAGRHQEAFYDVYWSRISRGNEYFSTNKLGAFGSVLASLSHFFEKQWHIPVMGLKENMKSSILGSTGFNLRALGRLSEAIEPIQIGWKAEIEQKNWENAAIGAILLSELYLTMGSVLQAIEYANKGVEYAGRSGDAYLKIFNKTTLADALHQSGRIEDVEKLFLEAEQLQKKLQPEHHYLYSTQGFQYCDLLFGKENYQEVLKRAKQSIEIAERNNWLLDIALDNLSLGRAHLLKALKEGDKDYSEAEKHLNEAVEGLRKASAQEFIARGLLARAELFCIKKDFNKARHDLDEAMTIVTRSEMKLYDADCHLGYARLYLAMDDKAKAREHHSIAKEMINKMGYHRRDKDVKEIEKLLEGKHGD